MPYLCASVAVERTALTARTLQVYLGYETALDDRLCHGGFLPDRVRAPLSAMAVQ